MRKEIPMLFSTPMVQAILEGRKTQTRRAMRPQVRFCSHQDYTEAEWKDRPTEWVVREGYAYCGLCGNGIEYSKNFSGIKCPYGQPGDRIWVRETWRPIEQDFGQPRYEYKATETINLKEKWKPSIFMPKAAARIWLEVVDVRVERLQDITWEDAVAESCTGYRPEQYEPTHQFRDLWKRINGTDSWDANPWVWVVEFKVLSTTGRPSLDAGEKGGLNHQQNKQHE